jgi:stress-induced morphogen
MFRIYVCSDKFKGKKLVEAHRMVNEAIKDELKNMHGATVITDIPQ